MSSFKVSIYGVDGSGKTALLKALCDNLSAEKIVVERRHWRPYVIRPRSHTNPDRPHGVSETSMIRSLLKVCIYFIDFAIGTIRDIVRRSPSNLLVLQERDFFDCYFDPKRYGLTNSRWFVRFLGLFLPNSDLVFLLVGDATIIHSRKNEVDISDLRESLDRIVDSTSFIKNSILLNTTSDDLETCQGFVYERITKLFKVGGQI